MGQRSLLSRIDDIYLSWITLLLLDQYVVLGREVGPVRRILGLDARMPQTGRQFHLVRDFPDAIVLVVTLCVYDGDGAPRIRLQVDVVNEEAIETICRLGLIISLSDFL